MTSQDDPISDDSSFYGDEDEKASLENKTGEPFTTDYWTYHSSLPQTIAYHATAQQPSPTSPRDTTDLHNLYEGLEHARQLHEPVSDFVTRLPPSTTTLESIGPWIWIANPHERRNVTGRQKAPDEAALLERGGKLLSEFLAHKVKTEAQMAKNVKATVTKRLKPALLQLESSIQSLAIETGCVSGKWMLFPDLDALDPLWALVAQGVAANKLGTAAKVATLSSGSGRREDSARLICVYTRSFADMKDVKRVLLELVNLGIVKPQDPNSRMIYYKSDAYTHLGIESNNEYGLRASLFSSRDVLKLEDT